MYVCTLTLLALQRCTYVAWFLMMGQISGCEVGNEGVSVVTQWLVLCSMLAAFCALQYLLCPESRPQGSRLRHWGMH